MHFAATVNVGEALKKSGGPAAFGLKTSQGGKEVRWVNDPPHREPESSPHLRCNTGYWLRVRNILLLRNVFGLRLTVWLRLGLLLVKHRCLLFFA
jgi:hypothetical protein